MEFEGSMLSEDGDLNMPMKESLALLCLVALNSDSLEHIKIHLSFLSRIHALHSSAVELAPNNVTLGALLVS